MMASGPSSPQVAPPPVPPLQMAMSAAVAATLRDVLPPAEPTATGDEAQSCSGGAPAEENNNNHTIAANSSLSPARRIASQHASP